LARALQESHTDWRRSRGELAWLSPQILPWSAWVTVTLDATGAAPAPTEQALEALWVRAIAEDADPRIDPQGLAELAASAATLMAAWRLAEDEIRASGGATSKRFLTWRARVERAVSDRGWTLPWVREDALRAAVMAAEPTTDSPPLILCGIEELDRQQQDLVDALRSQREVVDWQPDPVDGEPGTRVAANDPDAELELALRWAAAILHERAGSTVAVVIPDLEVRHAEVFRALDRVFDPARILPGEHPPAVFDVAVSTPLADEPVVAAALNAVAAVSVHADFETLSRWLRSNWFGHDEAAAIATEIELRERAHRSPGWSGLCAAARKVDSDLGARCLRISESRKRWPRRAPPSHWASLFQSLLSEMGWADASVGDRRVHHAREAWGEALAGMSQLDPGLDEVNAEVALASLRRLAANHRFQIESPGARLKILGLLDLAGLRTDALWVCGLSDEVWPRTADPNPLLPIGVQRDAGVPHASPERELAFAERVTAGLLASADQVVMSWPRRRADEVLRPSPLILDLAEIDVQALASSGAESDAVGGRQSDAIESWTDRPGPAMPAGAAIRGGSNILREQSLCPFRGFARARLDAGALEEPADGIPARERGNRAHELMEAFWNEVSGSSGLARLDASDLEQTLMRLAEPIYTKYARRRPDLAAMLATERRLMVRRAQILIESERDRPAFTTRAEKPESVRVGGAALRLKLDRVDRHGDGRVSIIDYKTGRQDDGPWFGHRPQMPQLPLYAVTQGPEVRAVAFASLHAKTTRFVGVAADGDLLPGIEAFEKRDRRRKRDADDFDGQMDHWRAVMTRLGEELLDGRSDLSPLNGACGTCDLASFCRIDEYASSEDGEDDD
jgi:ATP-dependent helicase/nuclease subunit B